MAHSQAMVRVLVILMNIYACSSIIPNQSRFEQQNQCVLKHMLQAYTENESMSLSNIAKLFDAVTLGYHKEGAPAHKTLSSYKTVPSDDDATPTSDKLSRDKRGIHLLDSVNETLELCDTDLEVSLHECLPGSILLEQRGYNPNDSREITADEFSTLCPALLFQMTMTPCMYHPHTFLAEKTTPPPVSATNVRPYLAWAGAIGSVLIISITGLATISIIPCLKNNVYKVAIQYLVALAVGTLVGDALLHLLPHALSEHEEAETDLRSSHFHVWRATVSLAGIFVFFNAERMLGVLANKKQSKAESKSKHDAIDEAKADVRSETGSCDSCADVTIVIGHSNRESDKDDKYGTNFNDNVNEELKKMAHHAHKELHAANHIPCHHSKDLVGRHDQCKSCNNNGMRPRLYSDIFPTSQMKRGSLPAISIHSTTERNNLCQHHDEKRPMLPIPLETIPSSPPTPVKSVQAKSLHEVHDTESGHEGHGHSHEVPESCSSVAYMVVMGDGLHNFTDGLAIGAAFAASFTGGLSTAIAVLCHELPHELGDFAMLLKSGMTVKQAYLCNLFSASLQCLGVVIGVLIGNVESASQYLFALAGGIFLYVGLVDMLPEITKVDKQRVWRQLLLQNLGLLTGFGLMLVIAIYETDIEHLFAPAEAVTHQ